MSSLERPASGKWAKAWREFAVQAAPQFAPQWVLCGKGARTFLARQPIGWWVSGVGYEPTGFLTAGHVPLTKPLHSVKSYRQDEYYGDDMPRVGFEPSAEDADFVFRWWINGPARDHIEQRTDLEWVELRERTFELARKKVGSPWSMLAGFRVIYDSGPAEPVIDAYLAVIDDNGRLDDERPWWEEFRTMVTTRSRTDVLRWLDGQRRSGLAAAGVPDSAVADVLTDLI